MLQTRIAVAHFVVKPCKHAVKNGSPPLKGSQRLQVLGAARLQRVQFGLSIAYGTIARREPRVELAIALLQCASRKVARLNAEAQLLGARFGCSKRRACLREFQCECARALLGGGREVARGNKFVLEFREPLAFACQAFFHVAQGARQGAKIDLQLSRAVVGRRRGLSCDRGRQDRRDPGVGSAEVFGSRIGYVEHGQLGGGLDVNFV